MVNNVLDLTDQTLDENQFLFQLKKAFDKGESITEVKINSDTALNLQGSIQLGFNDLGPEYTSVFGVHELSVVSARDLNQTTIDTHNVDAIQ